MTLPVTEGAARRFTETAPTAVDAIRRDSTIGSPRSGRLRGETSRRATPCQTKALAAYVGSGGSVREAAALLGLRPGTVKRHLADLRARSGLTTAQLIYRGRAEGWLAVPSLEPPRTML